MVKDKIELTKYTAFSGCGAKLGPALLDKALCGLVQPEYKNLIADFSHSEDAGIYKISDEIAIIQTVDFFPPIVDDPYIFGQIAAANALSDLYAMGASPITAMSVVGFPKDELHHSHLRAMMEGGLSKLAEAGAALVGGHSVEDREVKFGFAVTGIVHPKKVYRNNSLREGDALILTKKIGTGVINTALRAEMVSEDAITAITESMVTLNKKVAEIISDYDISACTDITGFGFLGHACEMINGSKCGMEIDYKSIPLFPNVEEYISTGLIPTGTYRNKEFRINYIENRKELSEDTLDVLFDPQTSGGLLFSVAKQESKALLHKLIDADISADIVGCVNSNQEKITIRE